MDDSEVIRTSHLSDDDNIVNSFRSDVIKNV